MSYNKDIFRAIREEYNTKYLRAREAATLRREEVARAVPEIGELDRRLSSVGLEIMNVALHNSGDELEARMAELRIENEKIQAEKKKLLIANGYPEDYTEVKYECPDCGDSGFVDCKMCHCMRAKMIEAGYMQSGLAQLMNEQSFDNFSLDFYKSSPEIHKHMNRIFTITKSYAENFVSGKSGSMVFFGGTGLGKTHLSSAIARTVIAKGCDVFYTTAVGCLGDFEYQRFGNSTSGDESGDTSRYFDCDLLIIDDMGTEVNNQFTTSVLYNIINTRLSRRLATIISTNLSQDEFRRRYWDRITSRVLGEYTVLPFVGTDIRAQKLK
ncbi:MAG: ATP-binding protein [Clostridia bacterium]|nr:ATP-binding protein [Clostridia bacterium]